MVTQYKLVFGGINKNMKHISNFSQFINENLDQDSENNLIRLLNSDDNNKELAYKI